VYNVLSMRPSELSKMKEVSRSAVTQRFKNNEACERFQNRLVSIPPNLVREYLEETNPDMFNKFTVCLVSNIVGGVGKTTATLNIGASFRRLCDKPLVYIDLDSQSNLSQTISGKPQDFDKPVMFDYFSNQASLDDILEEVAENTYIIRSSLNNAYLDRTLGGAKEIKTKGVKLLEEIKSKLGDDCFVIIDLPPQISSALNTLVVAMSQMDGDVRKIIANPLRSDSFAISGSKILHNEVTEILDTFNLDANTDIEIHTFFSSFDRRIKSSNDAYKEAVESPEIRKSLSSVAIRYSSEVVKTLNKHETLFSSKQALKSTASQDYMDLTLNLLGFNQGQAERFQ